MELKYSQPMMPPEPGYFVFKAPSVSRSTLNRTQPLPFSAPAAVELRVVPGDAAAARPFGQLVAEARQVRPALQRRRDGAPA